MKSIQQPTFKFALVVILILLLLSGSIVHAKPSGVFDDTASNDVGVGVAFITTATLTPSFTPEGTLTPTQTLTATQTDTPAATATPTVPPTTVSTSTPTVEATQTQEMIALSPIAAASTTPTDKPTDAAMQAASPTPTPRPQSASSDAGSGETTNSAWFILAMLIVVVLAGLFFRANAGGGQQ